MDEDGGTALWWLRSPGYPRGYAANVSQDGTLGHNGYYDSGFSGGVRPVFWLNLQA